MLWQGLRVGIFAILVANVIKAHVRKALSIKWTFQPLFGKDVPLTLDYGGHAGRLFSMRESTFMKKRASKCIYYPVMLVYKCLLFFGATNQKIFEGTCFVCCDVDKCIIYLFL